MGEKGEFEQRPEVKPASSIPLPKEKASPAIKILCVIFALVALGLGGFIVYDKLVAKDGDVQECTEVADDPGEIAEDDDEGDEDVDGGDGDVKDTSAKGFAKYAATNPGIGRVQLIHKGKNAAGKSSFLRLDMSKGAIRNKVLAAQSNDELSHIFQTDGIFED